MQAALPKAELRRSTRAATHAAQIQPHADQPLAPPSQPPSPQTPEDAPTATPTPAHPEGVPKHQNLAKPQGSKLAKAHDADPQSVQAGALQTGCEDIGAMVQPPGTAEQAHAEGAAHAASQDSSAVAAVGNSDTQLALTGKLWSFFKREGSCICALPVKACLAL